MTDIASKLSSILTAKNDIKQAVIDKGGSFNSVSSFAEYADAIRSIPTTNPSGSFQVTDGDYSLVLACSG